TERHADAGERVLPDLRRHVVADRRELVGPDVIRPALDRVARAVQELADAAADAAALLHRLRATVDLLAHALHPLGRAAHAALDRGARLVHHAVLDALGPFPTPFHRFAELRTARLRGSARHPLRAEIPAHCHDTSSAPAAVHPLRALEKRCKTRSPAMGVRYGLETTYAGVFGRGPGSDRASRVRAMSSASRACRSR